MVPLALYLPFLLASLTLIAFPGPNVGLIVSTSMAHGRRAGLVTVAGTSSAMALQLAVTISGMSAILAASAGWFSWMRWLGAAYLVYLGVRAWRAPVRSPTETAEPPPATFTVFMRGVLVSLSNPKTLFFFGAFFPQFVSSEGAVLPQLIQLALTFLALATVLDSSWALLAHRARTVLSGGGRWHNRLQSSVLIGAGLSLAIARKS